MFARQFFCISFLFVTSLFAQQTISPVADPYRLWAVSKWGATVVNDPAQKATVWGPNANPDGDAYINLQEYAFGTDPRQSTQNPVVIDVGQTAAGYMAMTVQQKADDAALVVIPQYSNDMKSWWPSLPRDSFSYTGTNSAFFWKWAEGPISNGLRNVTQVCSFPLKQTPALFTRFVVMRNEALAIGSPFDSLHFFDSISGSSGKVVESNSIVLSGFAGSTSVTVTGGARLIVNGVDVGTSATIAAGSTIRLRTTSPDGTISVPGSVTNTLTIGGFSTTWKATTRPFSALAGQPGTASGYTPVSVGASESGAANVSIPITVSPGTGGMEPKLAITYSSQGGNGLLGVGFGLSGLSAISRTGSVQYLDGIKSGVSFSTNDRFAFDGQRLVLFSGTYGGNGAEYRTESESFAKVTSQGATNAGPLSWSVKTKAGLTYEFGTTVDSRILANRSSIPGDTAVLLWALARITDNAGNYIKFTYAAPEGSESGNPRIASITYTQNDAAGLTAAGDVAFTYADRPDVRTGYVAGAKTVLTKRLTAVECRQGAKVARRYELAYQLAEISGNSQLTSVTEKGKQPDNSSDPWPAFPPTIFTWQQNIAANLNALTPTEIPILTQMGYNVSPPSLVVQGDFDGDGRMDLMNCDVRDGTKTWVALGMSTGDFDYKSGLGGFVASDALDHSGDNTYSRVRSGDFNGDGKTDILHLNRSGSNNWIAISNGDKSFTVKRGSQLGALQGVGQSGDFNTEILSLDVNGDGRTDVVLLESHGNNRVFLCQANGSFTEVPIGPSDPFRDFKISNNNSNFTYLVPGDFNGDGLADILLLYYAGQHKLALSNGDGTFTIRDYPQLGGLSGKTFRPTLSMPVSGDFNGDGLTDVANFDSNGTAWMALCKGDGTFESVTMPPTLQGLGLSNSGSPFSRILTGDFNGDGMSDLFHAYYSAPSQASWMAYSAGSASFSVANDGQIGGGLDNRGYGVSSVNDYSRFFVGDFDGDGTEDILHLQYHNANVLVDVPNTFLTRSNGFNSNRVTQVTNGHGGSTKIIYEPLTNPSVYTPGTNAVYPYTNVTGAMYVVGQLVTSNGVDGNALIVEANPVPGNSTTFYHYFEARALLNGHGYQGFSAVNETSMETGITTRTEYVTTDPNLAGRPSRQVRTLADGRSISNTQTSWNSNPIDLPSGKQTHFPYATQSVTSEYEINNGLGSAPVKTTTVSGTAYDAYGNLTDSTTDYGGGFYEVTHSTFTNDTAHWWLGRLSATTVTQTSPGPVSVSRNSTFEYSPTNGQLTKETVVTPESNLRLEKTYQHDAFGNITQSTLKDLGTSETRTTITTYTADGRFISQTKNGLNQTESKTFDPLNGTVLTQTGPNGLITAWIYDGFGRPLREIRPDGTESVKTYVRFTPGGVVPARTVHAVFSQSSGQPWQYTFFDVLDRAIGTMTPHFSGQLLITQQVYDNRGQAITASLPFFSTGTGLYTTNEFDPIGRVKKQTAPGNRDTTTTYAGLSATVTNPKNQTFASTSDLRGRTAASTSFGTDTVTNTHDPYGNLIKVDDGNGHMTTISYDGRGQKTAMTEPNSGTTTYTYNAFGEIKSQTDSLNRKTFFFYDSLGRLTRRLDPEGGVLVETDWEYDTAPNGLGKLARVYRLSDGYQESYRYDTLGRLTENLTQIGAMKFVTSTTFDEYGRSLAITYPTGFAVKNEYNGDGYLLRVRDAVTDFAYWTAISYNERGQLVEEKLGNNLSTRRAYDANTGLLQTIKAGTGSGASLNPTAQNLAVQFDSIGNLTQRQDLRRGITENFTYDGRNQLSGITGTAADPITIACDQFGNITSRSDTGNYTYGENGAGPHAVTRIKDANNVTQRTLHYDAAGNCTQDGLTVLAYNSSNQPTDIRNGSATLLFSYTPAHTRYRLIQQQGGAQTEKLYIGSLYERENTAAGIVHTHFIPAGGGIVAIHTQTQTLDASSATVTASKTRYVHRDHLGSLQTLTREDGSVDEVLDFDAWGRRRTFDSATHRYTYASVTSQTDRGFTGHEMLDAVGLIHMNGRIYDPTLGRFLSVDPIVQEAQNLQNYNRYSYVLNNPLSLTDPSGFFSVGKFFKKHWKEIAAVAVGVVTAGIGAVAIYGGTIAGALTAAVSGAAGTLGAAIGAGAGFGFGSAFTGTLLAGGSLGDALRAGAVGGIIGGVTAGAISGASTELGLHGLTASFGTGGSTFAQGGSEITASQFAEKVAEKIAVHGVIGGIASELQGDKFIHGFLAGGSSGFASPFIAGANLNSAGQVAAAAVVGGTASELGGGKFSNGAVTGAFVYLFNNGFTDALRNDARVLGTRTITFVEDEAQDWVKSFKSTGDYALSGDDTSFGKTYRGFRKYEGLGSKTIKVFDTFEPLITTTNEKMQYNGYSPSYPSWRAAGSQSLRIFISEAGDTTLVRGVHYIFSGYKMNPIPR